MSRSMMAVLIGAALLGAAGCGDGPVAVGGADQAPRFEFENPLRDAEPGEWAEYRTLDGKTQRYTFRAQDERTLVATIEFESRDPATNALLDRHTEPMPPNHFLDGYSSAGAVVLRMYQDRIVVAGRSFDCLCVEYLGGIQGPFKCWYSNEVPVLGLVRQERTRANGGDLNLELLDWSGHRR